MNNSEIEQHLNTHTSQSNIQEVDTSPFVYKGELVGLFPLVMETFKGQGFDLPIDRICRFMEIDYPIKDKKTFLRQSLKTMKEFEKTENFTRAMQHCDQDLKQLETFFKIY